MSHRSVSKRFWMKVNKTETCWLWTGGVSSGYGVFRLNGQTEKAHRLAYIWLIGIIPDGLELDHLCRVRNCVNPFHLEPVTRQENVRRSPELGKRFRDKPMCIRGHPFDDSNTYHWQGERHCRKCALIRWRRLHPGHEQRKQI